MTEPDIPTTAVAPDPGPAAVVVSAATGLVLVVLGAVLAFVGALLLPTRPVVLGIGVPVAWGAALLNFVAARLAQTAFARWWAPALPLGGWLLVVVPLWVFTPGGDQFFVYDDASAIYVLLGVIASAATIGTAATPADRSGR